MRRRILFLHNYLLWYRIPLFTKLHERHDVQFLLTREKKETLKDFPGTEPLRFRFFPHFTLFGKYSLAWPLVSPLLFTPCDIIMAADQHVFDTYLAFFIAKLRRKKFLIWSETFDWPRDPKSHLLTPLVRFISKHADGCIALGSKALDYFLLSGTPPGRLFYAPDTSNTYAVTPQPLPLDLKGKKVILYLGRIVRYKGLDILVKAFAQLQKERKDAVLLIAGDGEFKPEVEQLIRDLNLRDVHFLGYATEKTKGFYYSLADVFVLPSTFRDYDADCWGLVLNEAMALGAPVISTNAVGGAFDLIKDGKNGFRVSHGNVSALHQALTTILGDDTLRAQMGKESQKIINEKFTYDKMARGFQDAIEACYTPRP